MFSWFKNWLQSIKRNEERVTDQNGSPVPDPFVIFLDFDGVLHPYTRGTFVHLDHFHRLLDHYPSAKVVISSSWRTSLSLPELRAIFDAEYQHRVIGVTPELPGQSRELEIKAYLAKYPATQYVALDDEPDRFPSNPRWLVALTAKNGLDDAGLAKVLNKLNELGIESK